MSSTGQLVQAGGEAGPVGLHSGEELAVGHVVNRDPADFHAFVVVCLGLGLVVDLFVGFFRLRFLQGLLLCLRVLGGWREELV